MSTTSTTTTDDEQAQNQLRFEATVRWGRPLTHDVDDPKRLQERLERINVDGPSDAVTVVEFTDHGARVRVEVDLKDMGHSPELIGKQVRREVRAYNSQVIDGDDLNKVPLPRKRGLTKQLVRYAYEGRTRQEINGHVSEEVWEIAQEKAEGLDLEGAPNLEPEIHVRTLEGAIGPEVRP